MIKKNIAILFIILVLSAILRLYRININPPSLSWDESSLGYNAFLIGTSLHDEHGEYFPLARFIAFGDYKPPGYIYADVLPVHLFGLNEFSVRFPSAVCGIMMVLVTYLLVLELFGNEKTALLASLFIGVSPWSLQLSRAAYEANMAAFLNLSAVYFFLLSKRKKWFLSLSVILFIASFYTFNANRIIAPLLLLFLSVYFWRHMLSNKKWVIISVFIGIILVSPSIPYLLSRESKLRLQEVSIFNNLAPLKQSNEMITYDKGVWWAKIIHNRRMLYGMDFLKHYFDNFTGRFLFVEGDANPRLSVQNMGELYVFDLFFLIAGGFWLFKKRKNVFWPLFFWMIIVPIPAALAKETPHALRIVSILPVYQIIIAFGVYMVFRSLKEDLTPKLFQTLSISVVFLLVACVYYYLHNYYIHYPVDWSGEWQYGYKQMVSYVTPLEKRYDHIFVTESYGRPYIYFAFYNRYTESQFQNIKKDSRDWFGFWHVSDLGKIHFGFDNLQKSKGKILVVTTTGNMPGGFKEIKEIQSLKGDTVFIIGEKI